MDIRAIPGVGEKTADALAQLDDPVGAIQAEDVAGLARAPGISESRAARIVRSARLCSSLERTACVLAMSGCLVDSANNSAYESQFVIMI